MASGSFVFVAAMAALLVASTMAQSPAPSPSVQTPRKVSPTPAQSPSTTAAPSPAVTTPATAPTTDVTSPPSPSPLSPLSDVPAASPSLISGTPSEAPTPAQNGAVSASFTLAGSMAVVVLTSVFVI